MQSILFTPIGIVHNDILEPKDDQWGKVISEIHIEDTLQGGLKGLEDWSHLIVIFLMHTAQFDPQKHLVRHPQERTDMPEVGIFAQRARHRPNKIGITAVKLLGIEKHIVRVKGLDAIHGSPVLDLKPYAPIYDGVNDPLVPAWFVRLMQGYF